MEVLHRGYMKSIIPYFAGLHPNEIYEGIIYHYTSPEGFKSILENNALRLTRYDCLNDYKDGKIVEDLFLECLKELYDERGIDQEYYNEYKKAELKHTAFVYYIDKAHLYVDSTPYVCCFSTDNDSLQMWQYYSKNDNYEGYNIGIQLQKIRDISEGLINTGKVNYDSRTIRNNIKRTISSYYSCDIENHKNGFDRYSTESLSQTMARYGCFCKDESFHGENEARIVVEIPNNPKIRALYLGKLNYGCKESYGVQYRISHGLMTPYFDLCFGDYPVIDSVMIGPMASFRDECAEKNMELIKEFTKEKLGRKIKVGKSTIPVRSY